VEFPVRHIWSDPKGNIRAPHRDDWRRCDPEPFGFYSDPLPGDPVGCVICYIAPGDRVPMGGRQRYSKLLNLKTHHPKRGELEFSASSGASLPDRYRRSALLWALSVTDAVLVCVDRKRGLARGEAYRVLSHRQCVIRCEEAEAPTWIEHLTPLLLPTHVDFAVVRFPAGQT
jgi:hypothetical protein